MPETTPPPPPEAMAMFINFDAYFTEAEYAIDTDNTELQSLAPEWYDNESPHEPGRHRRGLDDRDFE